MSTTTSDDEIYGIIIDIGTYGVRAGVAGDDEPNYTPLTTQGPDGEPYEVPKTKYKITNWDTYERIVQNCLDEVTQTRDQPIFAIVSSTASEQEKINLTQLLFEKFEAPSCYVATESCLPLYASGRTTGLVVDMGHSATVIDSVYEGYSLPHVSMGMDYGGQVINKLFKEKCDFLSDYSPEQMDGFKKAAGTCFVTENIITDMLSPKTETIEYELPDKKVILGAERYAVPECFFTPSIHGIQSPGLHEMLYNCGMKIDFEVRDDMYNNIVLAGGCSKITGMHNRISDCLSRWGLSHKLICPPENHISWIGASILASLTTFEEQWLFKHEWEDEGESIVNRKFLI